MKNFIFQFLVFTFFLGALGCYAKDIETGKMVSAFLDATRSEKTYVHFSQLVFEEDGVYFLSEAGVLESVSLVGRDQNGLYVTGFDRDVPKFNKGGPKYCSVCERLLYDGNCMNPNCPRYFLN